MAGGRVTLSQEVREKLRIKDGDFMLVRVDQNHILMYPVDFGPREKK